MRIVSFALALLFARLATAQTDGSRADDFVPSTSNQPGQEYPQVNSQRYARFRIAAPEASSVRVSLGSIERGGFALTRGNERRFAGRWQGLLAALDAPVFPQVLP